MISFRADYELLSALAPDWGRVALLPWDQEIFGFAVADLQLAPHALQVADLSAFREALEEFCARTQARLISTHAAGHDMALTARLMEARFFPVEFSLLATLSRIDRALLQPPRFALRKALPEDHAAICRIAGSAFRFGRYHTDPHFSRDLANARYVRWVQNALSGSDPNDLVFVLGQPGVVTGFMHAVIRGTHADLRLGAVDSRDGMEFVRETGSFAGLTLYAETLRAVQEAGATRVSAKIAAGNTGVVNIFSTLGFQFSKPEVALHWRPTRAI